MFDCNPYSTEYDHIDLNTPGPMTYDRACALLVDEERRAEAKAEAWAEAGSGGVSLGYDGYEAASMYMAEQGDRFAPRAELSEARAYLAEFPTIYWVTEDGYQLGGGHRPIPHHPARKRDTIPF